MIITTHKPSDTIVVLQDYTTLNWTKCVLMWMPGVNWFKTGSTLEDGELRTQLKFLHDKLSRMENRAHPNQPMGFGWRGTGATRIRSVYWMIRRNWFTHELLEYLGSDMSLLWKSPVFHGYEHGNKVLLGLRKYVMEERTDTVVMDPTSADDAALTQGNDWEERLFQVRIPSVCAFLGLEYSLESAAFKQQRESLIRSFAMNRGVSDRITAKVLVG